MTLSTPIEYSKSLGEACTEQERRLDHDQDSVLHKRQPRSDVDVPVEPSDRSQIFGARAVFISSLTIASGSSRNLNVAVVLYLAGYSETVP